MLLSRFVVGIVSVSAIVLGAGAVSGQDYPNKPIRFVASGVGGGSDFTARLIAQGITGLLGQPIIIENRSGLTQGEILAKAPPDGHTLLIAGGNVWISTLLQKTAYDPVRDFAMITMSDRAPNILVVHPSIPVKSVKEFIALAKVRPGELNYATTSPGGSNHLAAELFKSMSGANLVHIPYKGTGQAVNEVIGGQVQLMFAPTPSVAPHIKVGKLRALAVTSATPSALTPGLPTVAATLPGYESVGLTGVFVPAGTPQTIINRLNQEIVRFLNRPEVKDRFLIAGSEIVAGSPEQSAATLKSDMTRWEKVIKDAAIKVD